MSLNSQVLSFLTLARQERAGSSAGDPALKYRLKTYDDVKKIISELPYELEAGHVWYDLIPGLGPHMKQRLLYFFGYTAPVDENDVKALTNVRSSQEVLEKNRILELFTSVEDVGTVRANEWYDQGYRTLESIPPALMTRNQALGIRYHTEIQERIPRSEIEEFENYLRQVIPAHIRFEICGSYRRGKPDSGDIDILLQEIPSSSVMDEFVYYSQVFSPDLILARGVKKCRAIVKLRQLHRRIDLEVCSPQEYSFAVLYFTGSKDFNRWFRSVALSHGYSLNEKGLTRLTSSQESLPFFSDEKDIFNFFSVPYYPPDKR